MKHPEEYAHNLEGTCLLAFDRWEFFSAEDSRFRREDPAYGRSYEQADAYAKVGAFALIVKHISGKHPRDFLNRKELEGHLGL